MTHPAVVLENDTRRIPECELELAHARLLAMEEAADKSTQDIKKTYGAIGVSEHAGGT